MEKEGQLPSICAFFAGLEEAVDVGPHALAQHLNHYGRDVFTELCRENNLKVILWLWEDPNWTPRLDLLSPPYHVLPGFLTGLRNTAVTHSSWLQQALAEPAKPCTEEHPIYGSNSPDCLNDLVT